MLCCCKKQPAAIYELKTDSVLFKPRKRAKTVLPDITAATQVRDLFEPVQAGQVRLDEHFTPLVPVSTDQIYRVSAATPDHLLASNHTLQPRQSAFSLPALVWRDLSEEQAEQCVIDGHSLLVLGMPGAGKTTVCRTFHERLQSLQKKVAVISKTHAAAVRAGGCTADHFVRKYLTTGTCNIDTFWVDEVFQLDTQLWAQLQKLKGRQWILSGDQHQFGPIFDSWNGASCPSLYGSRFLHQLCGGRKLILTECRRSETELFRFYTSLVPGGSRHDMQLKSLLDECKQRFNLQGVCRHNLCIRHAKRLRINAMCNGYLKQPGAVLIKAPEQRKGQLCAPQDMWVWPGIELLGCADLRPPMHGCFVLQSSDP
jgi:hypothetical protein